MDSILKPTLWRWAVLLLLIVTAGCDGGPGIRFPAKTARDAAVQEFQLDARRRKAQIDWNAVKILQEQPVQEDGTFLLLSFPEIRENGQRLDCLYYYGAKRSGEGWRVAGSGGGCGAAGEAPADGAPIQTGSGSSWSRDPQGLTFSIAEGFVFSNRVAGVDITWEDGVKQHAEVINQTYLAVRLELREVQKIEALDAEGEIIYTYTP